MQFFSGMIAHFQGHLVMWFILLAGAVGVAITLEKFYLIYVKYNINGRAFYNTIENHVKQNDIEGAVRLCADQKNALLAHVLKFGLLRANRDNEQIQNAIDAAIYWMNPPMRLG